MDERAAPGRLRLTSLIGRPVGSASGHRVGWARDLVVDLGSAPPGGVTGLVVGDFNERWLLPWSELTLTDLPEPCWLATGAEPVRLPLVLADDELMLVRDVLDCRVYDVAGRRTARVGEVWLDLLPGHGLEVAGLEVGARVVMHRLGLPRRHDQPPGETLLPLSEVHLTSARGHEVQLGTTTSPVHRMPAHELAHLLTHLPVTSAADVVRRMPRERVGAATRRLHPHVLARLLRALDGQQPVTRRRSRRTAGWRIHRPSDASATPPRRRS